MGVADGVYMWKQQGIDSGLFSRSLMRYAKQALKDGVTNPVKGARPSLRNVHGYQHNLHSPHTCSLPCRQQLFHMARRCGLSCSSRWTTITQPLIVGSAAEC